jgi:hypothetical protein
MHQPIFRGELFLIVSQKIVCKGKTNPQKEHLFFYNQKGWDKFINETLCPLNISSHSSLILALGAEMSVMKVPSVDFWQIFHPVFGPGVG